MKAIIEISQRGAVKARALSTACTLDRGGRASGDYHLGFESAAKLFAELTPARMALLESLKALGPVSIYALAKHTRRNYSNVNRDCAALEGHGLIEKDAEDRVFVPRSEVRINVAFGGRQEGGLTGPVRFCGNPP